MFEQFRRRQLISNISIFSALILIIFSSLYLTTYNDISRRNENELIRLIDNVKTLPPDVPIGFGQGSGLMFAIVIENDIMIETHSTPLISNEVILDIKELVNQSKGEVIYGELTFQYISQTEDSKTTYAFIEISRDKQLLSSLLVIYIIIFFGSVFVVGCVSYYITTKSLKPVKDNYNKQKEFVSNASHELKTPLAVISANIDVLLATSHLKDNKWLKYIKEEILRMNKLTNDLLSLSKAADEEQTLTEYFDGSCVINSLILGVEALAYEKKLKLESFVDEGIFIHFNKAQFNQLILILIDNAIKYSSKNNIITISFTFNKKAYLKIRNTGVSLTKEEKSNVFERFYMSDKSREIHRNSFGLGLSIAKEIVKKNHAEIQVDLEENNYTEFSVII
jgi:signal transduction histidine kinase